MEWILTFFPDSTSHTRKERIKIKIRKGPLCWAPPLEFSYVLHFFCPFSKPNSPSTFPTSQATHIWENRIITHWKAFLSQSTKNKKRSNFAIHLVKFHHFVLPFHMFPSILTVQAFFNKAIYTPSLQHLSSFQISSPFLRNPTFLCSPWYNLAHWMWPSSRVQFVYETETGECGHCNWKICFYYLMRVMNSEMGSCRKWFLML